MNNFQSSTGGVRLYYEGASGWIPGSYDVNVLDPQKLYYITDKKDNFYSLARYENFINTTASWINNTPVYAQFEKDIGADLIKAAQSHSLKIIEFEVSSILSLLHLGVVYFYPIMGARKGARYPKSGKNMILQPKNGKN
jgi:hypothetical protein